MIELPKVITDYIDQQDDDALGRVMSSKLTDGSYCSSDGRRCLVGAVRDYTERGQVNHDPAFDAATMEPVAFTYDRLVTVHGLPAVANAIREYIVTHRTLRDAPATATVG